MKKISLFLILLLYSALVSAQIVNVEKKRKGNPKGFQATVMGEFNVKEAGSRILEFKNSIDLQYARKAHSIILLNDISLLKVDKGSLINSGFQHLRYNYTLKDSSFITLEAFGQSQYSEQKLLQQRFIGGGGPRFRIANRPKFSFYIAPLAMYEYEKLTDSLHTVTELVRLDAYVNLSFTIAKNVEFRHITYYQPAFSDFEDYRISGEATIRFIFTRHFSFDIGYVFDYDSDPAEGIQNYFYHWKNKLVFTF